MTPAQISALCQPERIEVYIGLGLAALIGYGVGALWPWFKHEVSADTLQWYGRDQETGAEVRRRLFGNSISMRKEESLWLRRHWLARREPPSRVP